MKVFCILSDARAFRSKSPGMHTFVLRKLGLSGVYVPFMVEPHRVGDAVRGLRALNMAGANVTVPYKEAVVPHLDALVGDAEAVAAVNTIVPGPNGLIGHNTDVGGFKNAIAATGFDMKGKTALVMGTGGAAKAVVYALTTLAADRVVLAGRGSERTTQVAERFGASPKPLDALLEQPLAAHLLVNATPVSSFRESPELGQRLERWDVSACELVVDLNYGRKENFWLELAARVGAQFTDGLSMLVHQARLSFALWTGIEADTALFMEGLEEPL
jgi:shikimate dehydrogenase